MNSFVITDWGSQSLLFPQGGYSTTIVTGRCEWCHIVRSQKLLLGPECNCMYQKALLFSLHKKIRTLFFADPRNSPHKNLQKKVHSQLQIAQFRYIKIQLETKDITTRLRGMISKIYMVYSPKPCSDVFCFKMNFKISKSGYSNPKNRLCTPCYYYTWVPPLPWGGLSLSWI